MSDPPQYSRITCLDSRQFIAKSIRSEQITEDQWDADIELGIVVLHALHVHGRHLILFHDSTSAAP
jgi:hypothetical protein